MSDPARPDVGAAVIGLLEASHRLHPDHVPQAVANHAAALGVSACRIFLIDLEQRVLVDLGGRAGRGEQRAEELDVDGTLAGRAYRLQQPHTAEVDGRSRLWLPLLDGAERLGVVGFDFAGDAAEPPAALVQACRTYAAMVAEVVVSKNPYGDHMQEIRRPRRALDLAAELRYQMLPPLSYGGERVEVAGVLEPAYEIAGDTFDYALNGSTLHVGIMDAMGHGLEASRAANLAVSAYRNVRRSHHDLVDILSRIDEVMADQYATEGNEPGERFLTGQLATVQLEDGALEWVSAGHPRPLLLRANSLHELPSEPCLPIGLGGSPGEIARRRLEPNDIVLFFTDGVVEARNDAGELFGTERLGDALVRSTSEGLPLAETARRISHLALDHEGGSLHDDATLVLVRWLG